MPDMPDRAPNQSTASAELDKTTMNRLIEKANERDKQRLKRLDCEHANAWITAQPSTLDGKDTILPKIFLTAVFSASLFTLILFLVHFACKPWMRWETTPSAAGKLGILSRDTTDCAT
jgi:hypothetical protein